MFIHETHLPQILTPWDYTSQEQFDREVEQLFLPGWHLVGTKAELPRDGDFITVELLGRPLIVWRRGDEYHAFLNICPHRFSMLSHKPCGHAEEHLKCQYHGWEFDETGNTCKIPDARSFKPLKKGELGLQRYHTALCGQLIFVSFAESPCELREYLGPGFELGERLFADDRKAVLSKTFEVDANWKVKVENSLESYHVDLVHPTTFGKMPDAEICEHELEPRWTTYATPNVASTAVDRFLDNLVHRLAKVEKDPEYKQYHYYPNNIFAKMSLFSWAEISTPVSPTRTRIFLRVFCYGGRPGRLRSRLLARGLRNWGVPFFNKLAKEDGDIVVEMQKGINAPRHPSTGLVSIREERCHHFQDYIRATTGAALPPEKREAVATV